MLYNVTVYTVYISPSGSDAIASEPEGDAEAELEGRKFRRDNRESSAARNDDDDWAKQNGKGQTFVAWSRN
jgi:hypothetical protein